MNKVAIVVVVVGVILSILAVLVFVGIEEDSRVYDGNGGVWKIEEGKDGEFTVVMKGTYQNGKSVVTERGANLTTEDCDLVKNFTLENSAGQNFFEATCVIYDDGFDDGDILIGYICKHNITNQSRCNERSLPDAGEYTWNTQDTEIEVYDGVSVVLRIIGSIISCCCGVVVVIVGIILAFTMDDPQTTYETNQDSNLFNQAKTGVEAASGWDAQEDYIRKDRTKDETKEEAPETDQKEGEYEIPPPE